MNDGAFARLFAEYAKLGPRMNERERRLWAARQAKAIGRGGPSLVFRATGLTRPTIYAGMRELNESAALQSGPGSRVRRPSGGRKSLITNNTLLLPALDALIEPTNADANSALRWSTSLLKMSS
jgi:hypothetical protein